MIDSAIKKLVQYGLESGLIEGSDKIYAANRLLELLHKEEYLDDGKNYRDIDLEQTLKELLDYACERGLAENTTVSRDLFDTKLMAVLTPRPSEVIRIFNEKYQDCPRAATDYFYQLCCNSDYIRRYRVKKDVRWKTDTPYGALDISINLSKPEIDPKAIAAAKYEPKSSYPKCLLCPENEGYAGTLTKPARQNHRVIPVNLGGEKWGFQYSPYVYYNEHCIVFNCNHTPMKIDKAVFQKLFDFLKLFPHYFIGSNADLPIVGGSILSHEHFQGGRYEFPMAKAQVEQEVSFRGFRQVKAGIVKWPMPVIRLTCTDEMPLAALGGKILEKWRAYTDEDAFVYAHTGGEDHNTITPIARKRGETYELDLVLRNNITTKEHPLGVYHPHQELHHIKKENIGLIEVMGLAVLPARLKAELDLLAEYLASGKDVLSDERISRHAAWASKIRKKYPKLNGHNIDEILHVETGIIFLQVLEDAGVFKDSAEGRKAFLTFLHSI